MNGNQRRSGINRARQRARQTVNEATSFSAGNDSSSHLKKLTQEEWACLLREGFCMSESRSFGKELPSFKRKVQDGEKPKRRRPMMARVTSLADHFSPNRFQALEVEETEAGEYESENRISGPSNSATTQADSHRQMLDRKAQKSPARKSMEDDLIRLQGKMNVQPELILLDCGSTLDLISTDFVKRHNLQTVPSDSQLEVDLADGTKTSIPRVTAQPVKVVENDFNEQQTFTCYPLSKYDAILGKPWLWRNNPAIDFRENLVKQRASTASCSSRPTTGVELNFISSRQTRHKLRQGSSGFTAWVTTPDSAQHSQTSGKHPEQKTDLLTEQQEETDKLLQEYKNCLPVELPAGLPTKRVVNHDIDLIPGSSPPSRAAYRLSQLQPDSPPSRAAYRLSQLQPDLEELQRQLTALLERGFIEPSKSPFGAPVFFVKKQDGSLHLVCDWRDLNRITIKNETCLPNIDDLFDTGQGSTYFTKLDLHSEYNQVRIRQEDIPKTAINTPRALRVPSHGIGICNAPATFQSLMNQIS